MLDSSILKDPFLIVSVYTFNKKVQTQYVQKIISIFP